MYGTGETNSSNQANSLYTLDGSTPRLSQESRSISTSNILLYVSPLLEDAHHALVIQNLAPGGEVWFLAQRALTPRLNAELKLDYFEVTGSTVQDGGSIPTCECRSPCSTSRGI